MKTYLAPVCLIAAIRFSGIPHKPKPPTSRELPSLMSCTASSAVGNTFADIQRTLESISILLETDNVERLTTVENIFASNTI